MIEIVMGDDINSICNYLFSIKKQAAKDSLYEFTGVNKNKETLLDLFNSSTLFNSSKTIICKLNSNESPDLDFVRVASDSSTYLFIVGNIDKRTKFYKDIEKLAKFRVFDEKFNDTNFKLCNEIIVRRNKKAALAILNQMEISDSEFYAFLSLLQTYIRNSISKDYENKVWVSLKPFFKKTFESNPLPAQDELVRLYQKLLELDVKSKSGISASRKALIQDFVIYSI